jgi:TonB family protein
MSVAAHLVLLAIIVFHRPRIVELNPTWLAWGDAAHTYHITYIPSGDEENPADEAKLRPPTARQSNVPRLRPQTRKPKPAQQPRQPEASGDEGTIESKAGTALGTVVDGPISGHEVHVAYPVVYPDPPVDRAGLPRDLVGDVVIEVTIDSQGNVVDTKIVQAIGHGIDEKIEATLRRWHYQPATLDGTPVASHHDVHFHFPS